MGSIGKFRQLLPAYRPVSPPPPLCEVWGQRTKPKNPKGQASPSLLTYRPFEISDMSRMYQTWQSDAPDFFRNPVFVAHDGERIVGFVEGRYGHGNEAYILEISEPVFIAGYEEELSAEFLKTAFWAWVSTKFPDITHYRQGMFGDLQKIPAPPCAVGAPNSLDFNLG